MSQIVLIYPFFSFHLTYAHTHADTQTQQMLSTTPLALNICLSSPQPLSVTVNVSHSVEQPVWEGPLGRADSSS